MLRQVRSIGLCREWLSVIEIQLYSDLRRASLANNVDIL